MLRTTSLFRSCIASTRYFHSSAFVSGGKKVVATRKLLKTSQSRHESQGFELIQWPKDSSMPRDLLLEKIKGAEGLICMLSDKS
jgi:glyoxylate/hydroxypyruvate reductase